MENTHQNVVIVKNLMKNQTLSSKKKQGKKRKQTELPRSVQIGMNMLTFVPEDYENIFFKGWQRSGTYAYLPQNQETCCPQYGLVTFQFIF
jgi:hypothetical protein